MKVSQSINKQMMSFISVPSYDIVLSVHLLLCEFLFLE